MGYKGRYLAQKQPVRWKKVVLISLAVIVALVLMLALAVAIYWNAMLNKINHVDSSTTAPTLSSEEVAEILGGIDNEIAVDNTDPTDPLVTDESQMTSQGDKIINIMLIGQDKRTNSGVARGLSDTMILCSVNLEDKTITFTSFMRDMYVKLPNYNGMTCGYNRINTNYALGGMGMLDQCLLENFGVEVDHNVEVDFEGFKDIVDLIGGVDIELTKTEANAMNKKDSSWKMKEGVCHLNGEQALYYARLRKIDSDFNRTNRQRNVMVAILAKLKTMNVADLHKLLNTVLPMITTDMTNEEITEYAALLIPILKDLEVQTLRIPADDAYYSANKGTEEEPMYVLVPDLEKNRALLREYIGVEE